MDAPSLQPIVPLQPIAPPPPTPEETIRVLSDPGLLANIAGTLGTAETRRLELVSTQVRQASEGAQQLRLHELGQDPRVQQLALRVKSHLQKPVVRTGIHWDATPLLARPTTDVERVIDT
eukprot:COSAG06_NODE_34450_length_474_cov_0.949333_1_plen_119_part_10